MILDSYTGTGGTLFLSAGTPLPDQFNEFKAKDSSFSFDGRVWLAVDKDLVHRGVQNRGHYLAIDQNNRRDPEYVYLSLRNSFLAEKIDEKIWFSGPKLANASADLKLNQIKKRDQLTNARVAVIHLLLDEKCLTEADFDGRNFLLLTEKGRKKITANCDRSGGEPRCVPSLGNASKDQYLRRYGVFLSELGKPSGQ